MFLKLVVFALAVSAASCAVVKIRNSTDVLRIKVTKIEQCETDDTPHKINMFISIKDKDETSSYFSGNGTLPFDVDATTAFQLNVSKWKDDKWEPNVLSFKKEDPCKFANMILGEAWWKIQDRLKMPRKVCPIAKGFYEDKDLSFDLSDVEVPRINGGVFQAHSKMFKDDKLVMCLITDVKIW